jgi:hypothetical protein
MKNRTRYFTLLILCLSLFAWGCISFDPSKVNDPLKDKRALDNKVKAIESALVTNKTLIEDKGRAFVHGGLYVLNQATNQTAEIKVAGRFLELATLSLRQPSMKDARTIEDIADGLLSQYKMEIAHSESLRLESEADRMALSATNQVLKLEVNQLRERADQLQTESALYKKQYDKAEKDLSAFAGQIVTLQEEQRNLNKKHALERNQQDAQNTENALKAAKWDAENGFWSQFNIFADITKFFKKLFSLCILGGILFIAFKLLEIFFPAFNILGTIFGGLIRGVQRLVPSAVKSANLVGRSVWEGFKGTVKAIENTRAKLEREDIESDLMENYPDNYQFSKKEVHALLEKMSAKINDILTAELTAQQKEEGYALVQHAKAESGIKAPIRLKDEVNI